MIKIRINKYIALLLAIIMCSIVTPSLMNLKEINSYAYNNQYNLSNEEKEKYGIKNIALGNAHIIYLKEDGTVWGIGLNNGQLGSGNTISQSKPIELPITDVKEIYCGKYYTMFLKNDGTIWATGDNTYGQLGIGNNTQQNTPIKVNINNVKKVICSDYHTMFIKEDGTVWACGDNREGQLGIGNKVNKNTPVKVNITDVNDIACGANHTMFLKNDGTVWSCGGYFVIGIRNVDQFNPIQIQVDNVKKIICGGNHTMFLKNDGTAWACGYNIYGQLGIGNKELQHIALQIPIFNIKEITCGENYTVFLKEDGTVWTTGYNGYGQLGIGDKIDKNTIVKMNIDNVNHIFSGYWNNFFIKKDNSIWANGYNGYNLLCVDTTENNLLSPMEINNSLYTPKDLVLKAQETKLQTDLDNAQNKINELNDIELKTELLDRLNKLQIEITHIKNTTELIEKAEVSKSDSDINKAQDSINSITDTTIKKQLQDRLNVVKDELNNVPKPNYNKLLQDAIDKLGRAESSKNNIDITLSQMAIDKLNPDDKAILQQQLNNLKEQIKIEQEKLNYSKLLEDAEIKIIKAEISKKDYDISVAQLSISRLNQTDKEPLQNRLDLLIYNILLEDANIKVIIAEELRTDNAISVAQIAVDKIPHKDILMFNVELLEKPILQSKLDNLKLSIEEERYLKLLADANLKVTNAEKTKTLKDIRLAQLTIDRLKENDKTELQERLNALNLLIAQEEKDKNSIIIATTKVEQAEKMNTDKYLEEAKELVENLKEGEDKNLLLDRITAIETSSNKSDEKTKTLIYQAEVYVKQAEALKRESYIIKAQAVIDKIPNESPEKALLQARLSSIKVKK